MFPVRKSEEKSPRFGVPAMEQVYKLNKITAESAKRSLSAVALLVLYYKRSKSFFLSYRGRL